MRALIVDDEPIARNVLREELQLIHGIEVAGEAECGAGALEQIRALAPDLVFLDLQMPGMDGFEVIRRLEGHPLPVIVIVTAFDEHALRAFDAGAVDYLLKPVGEERLARCIERVRRLRHHQRGIAERVQALQELAHHAAVRRPRKIIGRLGEEYHLLDSSQVLAFQAERELVWILTARQRYLSTQSLRAIQEKLEGEHFARVHRNALVNLEHVAKMAPLSSQRWLLTLTNQREFVVSKRQAKAVQQLLRW